MDYEKKYKKALGWIECLYKWFDGAMKETAEHYFPELKESEDERIRKDLIRFVEGYIPDKDSDQRKAYLAWLEKQSKEARNIALRTEYEKGRADAIVEMQKEQTQEYLKGVDRVQNYKELTKFEKGFDCIADTYARRKNKDGYNKPWYTQERAAEMLYWAKEELGLLDRQNPVDKTEPKFHKGDWVVYVCGEESTTLQISRIIEGTYEFTDGSSLNVVDEDTLHLWTIEDAKDGDVLADGNLPFIFKKADSMMRSYAYCGISVDSGFKFESEGELGEWTWMQDIKPATKEQRDTLFAKIKEAGYEWDAEKKELKKQKEN